MKTNIRKLIKQSLYTKEGKSLRDDSVFLDYPRLKFQRPTFLSLNGLYGFSYNRSEKIPAFFKESILVPYPMEALLSLINKPHKKRGHYHFHKEFNVDDKLFDERVFLNVLRIDGAFTLFINGKEVYRGIDSFNLVLDVKDYLVLGINTLDFDFTSSTSSFLGITGQIFLEKTKKEYIKGIKILKDIKKETVTFLIDATLTKGNITIISPSNIRSNYQFNSEKITIELSDKVLWTLENPFFYQYEIVLEGGDIVNGYFVFLDFKIEDIEGIKALTINKSPVFIKGLKDDLLYPDGLCTMPSFKHVSTIINSIKKMGFNALSLKGRVELDHYYYSLDVYGLLLEQELDYQSKDKMLDILNYLNDYDAIFHILINVDEKEDEKELYALFKPLIPAKFLTIYKAKSKTSYGDFSLIDMKHLSYLNKKRKVSKPFLLNKMYFKKDYLENLQNFMDKKYLKYAINDLAGFFLESLSGDKNAIFSKDYRKLLISYKEINEIITGKRSVNK